MLLAPPAGMHHFHGVHEKLASLGWGAALECFQPGFPIRVTPEMAALADVLVHADSVEANVTGIVRQARASNTPTVLLMDGVAEYANTFLNPRAGHRFLRPAPGDVVLTAGRHDRAILRAMGNRAVSAGLPRLGAFASRFATIETHREPDGILVATATQPAFTRGGRARLLQSLVQIHKHATHRGLKIRWRIDTGIAEKLGVIPDTDPLERTLASCQYVLTTASTLALESILAGCPTCIIHPHPWPLWLPAAWQWHPNYKPGVEDALTLINRLGGADKPSNEAAERSAAISYAGETPLRTESLEDIFDAMQQPHPGLIAMQHRILRRCIRIDASARAAAAIAKTPKVIRIYPGDADENTTPTIEGNSRLRVVSSVEAHGSSVGGVSTWSRRMEQQFLESHTSPIHWQTLFIMHAFEQLVRAGRQRIAVFVGRGTSLASLEWIAKARNARFAGFLLPETPRGATLLGIPACSPRDAIKQVDPDAVLISNTSDDLAADVCVAPLRNAGIAITTCPDQSKINVHRDQVIDHASAAIKRGEHVLTTLPPDSIPGAECRKPEHLLTATRPDALVLYGDEIDFRLFAGSRAWRSDGTQVMSLRWGVPELSSPERFTAIVSRLDPTTPYAIYGAGLHTERLLQYASPTRPPIAILDDNAEPGSSLAGIPVIRPAIGLADKFGAIILSSPRYEPSFWQQTAPLRDAGVSIFPLYNTPEQLEVPVHGIPTRA